jgi:hypothetical protein
VRPAAIIAGAVALGAGLPGAYLALGGGSYTTAAVADPCITREWRNPDGVERVAEQIVLSALDGAASDLGVSREDLVLAVRSEDALDNFADEHGLTRDDAEQAVEDGLLRAVDDAEEAGALPDSIAGLARRLVGSVPPWLLLETLDRLSGFLPG